jgi:hypothetical protein
MTFLKTNANASRFLTRGPLTLPSPPAYRQAGAGERDRVRGDTIECNEIQSQMVLVFKSLSKMNKLIK